MKQLLFLSVLMLSGSVGSLYNPFWGLLLYYTLAVLRPQYLWEWALPFEVRWSLLAAVATAAGVCFNFSRLRGRFNLIAGLMLVYSVLLLMSVLTAYKPDIALNWGIEYAKILGVAVVATLVIGSIAEVRLIALAILLCIGYIAWEINSLYLFDGRLDIFHYGYAKLDNNGAGLMLAMGLPFAYAFGASAPKRWQRAGAWALGLLMIHAVLMSYSRGAMLASIVGAAWLLLNHRRRMQAAVIAVVLCVVVLTLAGNEIRNRFLSTTNYENDHSANARFESWSAAWQIATDHPLFGQGIRNSNTFTENYGADRKGRTIHSQYLQIAADSGIPAMAVYGSMMLAALVYTGRARSMCRQAVRELPEGADEQTRLEIDRVAMLALGIQASLLIFAFGAIFLSLEVFELPWLLIMIAGLLPLCVRRWLDDLPAPQPAAQPALKPAHAAALAMLARRAATPS